MPKYTSGGILYSLLVARTALADLAAIRAKDAPAADMILALLQEAKANQGILESFSSADFGAHTSESYHVTPWIAQQQQGRNLWRLKIWELEAHGIQYRVIYAFASHESRYYVLGVFERSFNYDESDPRTQRVLRAYESIAKPPGR